MNLREPWLSSLLSHRRLCAWIVVGTVILGAASRAGVPLWICPFPPVTGLPCPGCGVTRGLSALIDGRFAEAVALHPFVPLFALAWFLPLFVVVLPGPARKALITGVQWVERETALPGILLLLFAAYGLTRMAIVCFHHPGAEIPKIFQRTIHPKQQTTRTL